jgi:hypothetical protein
MPTQTSARNGLPGSVLDYLRGGLAVGNAPVGLVKAKFLQDATSMKGALHAKGP